ncbi:site-specific DNA-methyltransferase, partial [bacterium]|nr:site-specific DNA-methyltransferase [bacterium]
WASVDITGQTGHATPDQFYEIITPSGLKMRPPIGRCWAMAERTFLELVSDNRIWFGKDGKSRPRLKKFLSEIEGVTTWTWWTNVEAGHNQEATKELNDVMNKADVFDNPKPTRLIRRILEIASEKDSIVLDSFAGSGTMGHSVLGLNAADGGNRRFILVEMEKDICRNITAQRLTRVSQGYKDVPGLGSGFRFCELAEPLFDERGNIRSTVRFADLARHVYFTETGEPLPPQKKSASPLLGVHHGKGVYLLYNGILKDKTPDGGNVLTTGVLALLPAHSGPKVIYGAACRIGAERLRREQIDFKQLPYKLKVGVL